MPSVGALHWTAWPRCPTASLPRFLSGCVREERRPRVFPGGVRLPEWAARCGSFCLLRQGDWCPLHTLDGKMAAETRHGGGLGFAFRQRVNPWLAGGCPCTSAGLGRVSASLGERCRSRPPVVVAGAPPPPRIFCVHALRFSCPPYRGA